MRLVPLAMVWLRIGLQSFGGGATTLLLIERHFVQRLGWITKEELSRLWTVSLISPGINLVAVAALIGYRLRGAAGCAVSVIAMMLPCAVVTCLLSAGFSALSRDPTATAAMRGLIPATVAVLALVAASFAVGLAGGLARTGTTGSLRVMGLVVTALGAVAALTSGRFNVPVVILVTAAVATAIYLPTDPAGRQRPTDPSTAADPPAGSGR